MVQTRNFTQCSFQTRRSHILLVTETPGRDEAAMGIVTLEDVVEVNGVLRVCGDLS